MPSSCTLHTAEFSFHAELELYKAVGSAILDGIFQKVPKSAGETFGIALHNHVRLDFQLQADLALQGRAAALLRSLLGQKA